MHQLQPMTAALAICAKEARCGSRASHLATLRSKPSTAFMTFLWCQTT